MIPSGCPGARARWIALWGLAALACPKAPPALRVQTEGERLAEAVRKLSAEAAALILAQDEAVWRHWAQGAPLELEATYAGREALFGADALATLERARSLAQTPREARALTRLEVYLVGERLARALAEPTEAIANLEASMTFSALGQEHPYRELDRLLANERSAVRRSALYAGATPAVERLTQAVRRRENRLAELLRELGYESYEALGAELREADLEELAALADEVLRATEEPYLRLLDRLSRSELATPRERLRRADLPRLFRPGEVDAAFPRDSLLPRAEETLRGMGFELSALRQLRLVPSEGRRNPRPLSVTFEPGKDVRLSLSLSGGLADQGNLLHELGHALHHALSEPAPFELAKLGNITVSEAYAFLLQDLVADPVWLEEKAGLSGDALTRHLAASSAHKLYLLRRAAGSVLYELARHRQEGADPRQLYREIMSRGYGIELSAEETARHLVESEDFYQSADDLRAWILAGQLRAQLEARFGRAWWSRPEAGGFLRALFAHGNARSAEEIAAVAGEPGLRPEALVLRLGAGLGG